MGMPTCGQDIFGVEWGIRWAFGNVGQQVVENIEDCVVSISVACSFRSVIDNVEWVFAGVYCPNDYVERRYL